jgi:hypothetical protein
VFLRSSAMSTKLHSITLQKTTNLIQLCELHHSVVVSVYITMFLTEIVGPVHTYNNRISQTLVFESEDPVMLKLTLGALYTYAHSVVP